MRVSGNVYGTVGDHPVSLRLDLYLQAERDTDEPSLKETIACAITAAPAALKIDFDQEA